MGYEVPVPGQERDGRGALLSEVVLLAHMQPARRHAAGGVWLCPAGAGHETSSLGIAFKFAESEYVTKVNDLIGASKEYATLNDILDKDVENDSVKKQGSHSRNLRRVRLGLGLIKALFEQFLATEGGSLYDAATTAYGQVCAPFHSWAIRKAVGAGMYTLPSREQLIMRLNETDCSVQKEMRRYIDASSPIIEYIDNLFLSRNIVLDW
ncbi:unnamed protein product [Triticum turgidum subsp. durum]|uniref:Glycolipid transfer protein domain-containing protein n=1 Tax=Triticum turgidum subsp. durum TaxID=4567 RepID=A0A9R0W1G1_TRITD|nr:unnamed protein product [Triticum turgidum subsp. durum]